MEIPYWIPVGLAAATFIGAQTAYQKQALGSLDPVKVSFYTNALAVPPLMLFALLTGFQFDLAVLLPLLLSTAANIAGVLLIVTALEGDDVGVVASFRSFTPIGVALIEPLVFASEDYALVTIAASITAVIGTYILLVEDDYTAPIRRIGDRGPQLALGSALIYSTAFVLDRFALTTTSVPSSVYPVLLTTGVAVGLGLIILWRDGFGDVLRVDRTTVTLGGLRTGVLIFGILNLTLTTAANASIIIQFSNLVALGIGVVLFNEGYIGPRIIGGIVLILSVVLAVL